MIGLLFITVCLLAVTIDQLRLTLIPQLMCHRVRLDHKMAYPSVIVTSLGPIVPQWPFGKVKNNFRLSAKNKKNLHRKK
jgi:hypothetical protein